jgi:hypothetical protein
MPNTQVQALTSHQRARCDGTYERPADAFLSGSMSDCAEKGFVRNAMHPESSAGGLERLLRAHAYEPIPFSSAEDFKNHTDFSTRRR